LSSSPFPLRPSVPSARLGWPGCLRLSAFSLVGLFLASFYFFVFRLAKRLKFVNISATIISNASPAKAGSMCAGCGRGRQRPDCEQMTCSRDQAADDSEGAENCLPLAPCVRVSGGIGSVTAGPNGPLFVPLSHSRLEERNRK
jgi:hypothetical protein